MGNPHATRAFNDLKIFPRSVGNVGYLAGGTHDGVGGGPKSRGTDPKVVPYAATCWSTAYWYSPSSPSRRNPISWRSSNKLGDAATQSLLDASRCFWPHRMLGDGMTDRISQPTCPPHIFEPRTRRTRCSCSSGTKLWDNDGDLTPHILRRAITLPRDASPFGQQALFPALPPKIYAKDQTAWKYRH